MLRRMLHKLTGAFSLLGYGLNTLFWVVPILVLSILKLIPIKRWQTWLSYLLDGCASAWISVNNLNQKLTGSTRWDVTGLEGLTEKDWYLVISNHQSWVDILVLQRVFNRRIPFLKFFLKKELIWVPFLGVAWWALDFPFMQRYSKAFLAKHPHLKGKDLDTTRKACEKFQAKPVSIMNFVEGTRWSAEKQKKQGVHYSHLLKPRAGGLAFVLRVMGDQLHKLVNVTIHYPQGVPSFWDFACGTVKSIRVDIDVLAISELLSAGMFVLDDLDNPLQREKFQAWLNQIWAEKDVTLKHLTAGT